MAKDMLSELRTGLDGCEIAVLADVSTGTCLRAVSVVELGQERFAGLCRDAMRFLSPPDAPAEVFCLSASPLALRLFVRATTDDNEAICLVFAPSASLTGAQDAALAVLRLACAEIAADG